MATLDKLATELISHILEYLEPASLHSVALVSKRLAAIATEELRFCRKYRAISDQQPATVPSLLREILQGNTRAASRVRSIEIYGTRLAWDHWNDTDVYHLAFPEGHDAPAADVDAQGCYRQGFFSEMELERFYHSMVDDLSIASEAAETWRARIAEGNDAALKVLLIALCPQLRAVRFVQNAYLRNYLAVNEDDRCQPEIEWEETRSLLASVIASIFAMAERNWPPGLLSLEDLALGVKSKSASQASNAIDRFSSAEVGTTVASHFFCLPNLKNIYIHGLKRVFDEFEDDDTEYSWGPTEGCSSVQHILLENPDEPELSALDAMFFSSGRLQSVIFHGGSIAESFDLEQIFDSLKFPSDAPRHPSLSRRPQTLLFCGTEVHGYRSDMYEPDYIHEPVGTVHAGDVWRNFEANHSRCWASDWTEVEKLQYSLPSCAVTVFNGEFEAEHEQLIDQLLATLIRREWGYSSDEDEDDEDGDAEDGNEDDIGEGDEDEQGEDEGKDEDDETKDDDGQDEGDDKIKDEEDDKIKDEEDDKIKDEGDDKIKDEGDDKIKDDEDDNDKERNNDNDHPTNFDMTWQPEQRALYLTSLDGYPAERTYRWWSKTIAAGKKYGINVHTRTTKPPKGNSYEFHVQWPEGVSDNILETSPWHKHPSLPKVYFKPHLGFVEDCEHCGDCDECFKCYPPEVWAAIKKEESEEMQ